MSVITLKKDGTISITDAELIFKNFSGNERRYNPAGRRNFCVFLNDEVADALRNDGWNVKILQPKTDEYEPRPYISVAVRYDVSEHLKPRISLGTTAGMKTKLTEDTVSILDWASIESSKMIIRPHKWTKDNGDSGKKAYLQSLSVVVEAEDYDYAYYDVPDSALNSIGGCGRCTMCDGHCKHDDEY